MENPTRNPSLKKLALDRLGVGDSLRLRMDQVPNLATLRVIVSTYALRHGVKLSVHHNAAEKEIEIVRRVADADDAPIGIIEKARPRSY